LSQLWRKLPRGVYWTIGAAIAFGGAIVACAVAEQAPGYRVPIWLAGAIVIFFGLGVLSAPRVACSPATKAEDRAGKKGEARKMERVKGIEPSSKAWEAFVLPLNYTRAASGYL
jgi:hypothetical protein